MIMCVLLGTAVAGFGQDGDGSDNDSLHVMHYTGFDTSLLGSTNAPLAKVQAIHVLKFASQSLVFVKSDTPEHLIENNQAKLTALATNAEVQPSAISLPDGYTMMTLSSNEVFALQSRKSDGTWGKITSIDTRQSDEFGIIDVSENLGNALSYWKESEDLNLYDFLMTRDELSKYEVYEFLQSFVKDGTPLDDAYFQMLLQQGIPPLAFAPDPSPPDPGPEDGECKCRVINVSLTNSLNPTSSGAGEETIRPSVYPNSVVRETNRIKFWEVGSFMGPARYKQLWGETKRCRNSDESHTWGENANNPLTNHGDKYARLEVQQVCRVGNWTPGDCYCKQDLSFQYRYDAELEAISYEKGAVCVGNTQGKKAFARVEDLAQFTVIRQPWNPYADPDVVYFDASLLSVASDCHWQLELKRIIELFKLGFDIYAYASGSPFTFEDTFTNAAAKLLWKEFKKTSAFENLENLLTEPWVTAGCETASSSHKIEHTGKPVALYGREKLIFTLAAMTTLEVGGRADWYADARLLSGFGMSVVLEKNEYVGQPNYYCCTKPAGIYLTATLHSSRTPENYRDEISSHFNPQLGCCFPAHANGGGIVIENDRDLLIADDLPNCEALVNDNLRIHNNTHAAGETDKTVRVMGNSLIIEGVPTDETYSTELFALDGRLLMRTQVRRNSTAQLISLKPNLPSGVYIVRLITRDGNHVNKKIFLP